jgi:hypothetical protein
MVHEARRSEPSEVATFHVVDKLRPHLAALAGAEVSWLRAVHGKADGTLEGLEAPQAKLDPAEFREGKVVLLAELLGLLVAFIGMNLTLRLVGEIWPQISLGALELGNGGDGEKIN